MENLDTSIVIQIQKQIQLYKDSIKQILNNSELSKVQTLIQIQNKINELLKEVKKQEEQYEYFLSLKSKVETIEIVQKNIFKTVLSYEENLTNLVKQSEIMVTQQPIQISLDDVNFMQRNMNLAKGETGFAYYPIIQKPV
eukprot:TRINITY_DN4339_c0_g1_i1.p1 TRINITY_DN4339_c0_g1~~TRINITY_DN4339_c0_g1_i1.p1  ORF type:complete len:152 (+),score=53.08 TRINITY_DN4339_c0_g1_i1:37-456(+)